MAARSFRNDDEEAQHCLSILRDGTREEKIDARERLADICSRRHLFEEAAELYESNIRAGVRSPELFERLSETYRHLGDHESADAALVEARRTRSPTARPARREPAGPEARVITFPLPPEAQPAAEPSTAQEPLAPAQPGRTKRSIPGPLLALGVAVFLIVIPVMLLALFVANPIGLYLEGLPAGPTVSTTSGEPAHLKIAAGMSAGWYLHVGRSVSGLWATPGLDLTLDYELEGVGRTFAVTSPRQQAWGESITIVERRGQGRANQETVVLASFIAPTSLPPPGTVLDGWIRGQITAPRLTDDLQFTTTTEQVELPVRLVVVSGSELWQDRLGNMLRMFFDEDRWLLLTISAVLTWCVLAGGAAILFRAGHS
jgi:hypothetical protein